MLRVAFVLRSTEVHPAFCDLSPQCLYAHTHHIILICYGMCVYIKAFEAARSNTTAHHIAFDVSWCGTLGFESFFILANSIQPSLYGGFGCVLLFITREFRRRSTYGRRALRRLHLPYIGIWTADALQTFTDKCSTL